MKPYCCYVFLSLILAFGAWAGEEPASVEAELIEDLKEGSLRQLTDDPATDIEPKWAPDGSTLAFASNRTVDWNVFTIGTGDSVPAALTTDLKFVHSTWWSPDSTRIAIAASERSEEGFIGYIYIMDLAGGGMKPISSGPVDGSPCWSPDGRLVAFVSNRTGNWDIWVCAADSGGASQLTTNEAMDHSPRWSPDGKTIAFFSARTGGGDIWLMDADGKNERRLTTSEAFDHFPSWSPAGDYLVFHSNRSGDFDIWVIPASGGEPMQITSGPANDMRPAWSPDGKSIAFTSNRGGNDDIWLLEAD